MTVIGALSSFRELGEMSPHKRAIRHLAVELASRTPVLLQIPSRSD
jgi:hypothetical protein